MQDATRFNGSASRVSDIELEHAWFAYGDRPRIAPSSIPPVLRQPAVERPKQSTISTVPPPPSFDDPVIDSWLRDVGD